MMFFQIAAMAAERENNQYGFEYPQLYNSFNYPVTLQAARPLPYAQPQVSQPVQTPQSGPSDLERLIVGGLQLAGVLAEAYIQFVVVPKLKAEVDAELKEAAREERVGDFVGLLMLKYGLNKASGN